MNLLPVKQRQSWNYTGTHVHTLTQANTHTHTHTHTHTNSHTHTHTHKLTHVHTHTNLHTNMQMLTQAHTHAHTRRWQMPSWPTAHSAIMTSLVSHSCVRRQGCTCGHCNTTPTLWTLRCVWVCIGGGEGVYAGTATLHSHYKH